MAGISSKAAGKLVNRKKFNGIEHTTELDLNTYDAFFRNADPQIGRWWQIDPKPNVFESPYAMMGNHPVLKFDPLGDTAVVRVNRKLEIRYVDGNWINSSTRAGVDPNTIKNKGVKRIMADYSKLNTISDFSPVTVLINSSENNVVLSPSSGPSGGSETQARKYFSDLKNKSKPDILVNSTGGGTLSNKLFNGNSGKAPSYITLGHELGHAWDLLTNSPSTANFVQVPGLSDNISNSEVNAMYWENILRINGGLPLRTHYNYSTTNGLELPARIGISTGVSQCGCTTLDIILSNLDGKSTTTKSYVLPN